MRVAAFNEHDSSFERVNGRSAVFRETLPSDFISGQ